MQAVIVLKRAGNDCAAEECEAAADGLFTAMMMITRPHEPGEDLHRDVSAHASLAFEIARAIRRNR